MSTCAQYKNKRKTTTTPRLTHIATTVTATIIMQGDCNVVCLRIDGDKKMMGNFDLFMSELHFAISIGVFVTLTTRDSRTTIMY